ncbi:MAG TPA: protein kinase [Gemmatales bacterium]|nr:protein kinase [Gemmatales bacterium]
MSELNRKQMAQLIIKLRLATPQQIQDCLDEIAEPGVEAEPLLATMSRNGILTSLQVDKLLKGDMNGYFMGNYRLLYKIHSGTFGRVYRADERGSGRVVAVKVLRQRWTDKPEGIHMFEREGRLGMSIRHPNIVEVLSVGKEEKTGQYYIVMEFVEGANLRDLLSIRKTFDTIETLKILEDICSALAYASSRGVTHRDMKPTNILISSSGITKVTDYGLAQISARFVTEEDKNNQQQRTVDYAGLEKATDAPYGDVRSDIYFTGCIAYEMLTGRSPLAHTRNKLARMARDRFLNVVPLQLEDVHGPGAAAVHRLVLTMMELDPLKRYQTAAQLLDAVKQARADATGIRVGSHVAQQTVFVVENDEKLQDALRDKLKKMKYRVLIASDPARAFDRFQQSPFHVLLVDIGTVGEDSISFINKVLRKAKSIGVPCHAIGIISEDQTDTEQLFDSDMMDHVSILRRPLRMHDLTSVLERVAPPSQAESSSE